MHGCLRRLSLEGMGDHRRLYCVVLSFPDLIQTNYYVPVSDVWVFEGFVWF